MNMEMKFCQSCGMPLTDDYKGTNADGSRNEDYCNYCYMDGRFMQDMTMEQMIEHCLKKNRELLDDSVHSNRFKLMLLNCNTVYIEDRVRHLKNCEVMLNQLFLIHLSFIFHLNSHYLMASDYMDYMEMGMTPPEGSENWIAPFAQDAFDKIIKPHMEIANFITSTCPLEISQEN